MSPWLIIGFVFLGIGCFSIIMGRKRLRQALERGEPAKWYKSPGLLTGIEYILISIIIFLNLFKDLVPTQFQSAFATFYIGVLILGALSFLVVMFTILRQPRQTSEVKVAYAKPTEDPEKQAAIQQRKRERRQKAAAARRRHAGRA
jgi:hypothetical protein